LVALKPLARRKHEWIFWWDLSTWIKFRVFVFFRKEPDKESCIRYMTKNILALNNDGQLILKSANGVQQLRKKSIDGWVILAIDCSSSMRGSKLEQAKQGILSFAEQASQKCYSVGLVRFSSHAELICTPSPSICSLPGVVQGLAAGGSTDIARAITLASDTLCNRHGSRSIVLVSDGEPDSRDDALEASRNAKQASIEIIAIGVDGADLEFLRLLATRSDLATHVTSNELRTAISASARLLRGLKH
jgi:Mg-chelatase subunit ChlD